MKAKPKYIFLQLLVLAGVYWTARHNYLFIHSLMELFTVVVASLIFVLGTRGYRHTKNANLNLLGIGFACVGAMDLLHLMAYKGMGVFPGLSADVPTQLWICGRYLASFAFLSTTFEVDRLGGSWLRIGRILLPLLTITMLVTIFFRPIFPHCFIEEKGLTSFKIVSEYLIACVLLFGAWRLKCSSPKVSQRLVDELALAMILTAASEVSFTLYTDVYGVMNFTGHVLKAIVYFRVLLGVAVTGIDEPYQRVSSILENIPWGYVVVDLKGSCVDINDHALECLGLTRVDVEADPLAVWPHDSLNIEEILSEGKSKNVQIVVPSDDGTKNLMATVFPTILPSGSQGVMAWFMDVTEQRTMELHLQHNDRLVTVGEMTSIVAHDIRNPLSAIKSYAQLVQMHPEKAPSLAQWKRVNSLVDDINTYLDKILTFCKPSKEMAIDTSVVPLIDNVLAILSSRIGYSKVHITKEICVPEPIVNVNILDFQHVLLNLIKNALDAMGDVGELSIKAGRSADGNVVISIKDNGPGISTAHQARIWDMFFTTKAKGSGIGLAMAKRVVEQHGGTIGVSSQEGIGTVFTITLPSPECSSAVG